MIDGNPATAWMRQLRLKLFARLTNASFTPRKKHSTVADATGSWRSYLNNPSTTDTSRFRIIGYGKKGTVVYIASHILDVHQNARMVQVATCQGGVDRVDLSNQSPAELRKTLQRLHLTSTMAVKDVRDNEDAISEASISSYLQMCFSRASSMRYCVMHPTICSVTVDDHVLIPMRLFQSNTTTLIGSCSTHVAIVLCQHVMKALDVMHNNGIIHLDVKPSNILIWSTPRSQRFVLGDYDIVAHVDDVIDIVRRRGLHGTAGYVSPIMSMSRGGDDDDDVYLHPRYVKCCNALSKSFAADVLGLPKTIAEWIQMFSSMQRMILDEQVADDIARQTATLCDMHGLAVTLFELLGSGFIKSGVMVNIVAALLTGKVLCLADMLPMLGRLSVSEKNMYNVSVVHNDKDQHGHSSSQA